MKRIETKFQRAGQVAGSRSGRARFAVPSLTALVAFGALGCGSADEAEHGEHVVEAVQPLWLSGTKWPNGRVNVCWDANTVTRADFNTRSNQIMDLLNKSWVAVANVEFVGWAICGQNLANQLKVKLEDSTNANAGGIGFNPAGTTMTLGVNRPDFLGGLIPHEFGHALGFSHEMARGDFADSPAPSKCRESNVSGDRVNTAPDRQSIMASTGYCQTNANLSLWDIVGVIAAYGPRVNQVSPLITGWSSTRGDHATMATATGIADVNAAGDIWAYAEGWVFNHQVPGTVPLKLYWHSASGDNFSTATAAGQADAVAGGYTFVRNEGFVFSSAQTGTVPLRLYWHSGFRDNMLTTAASGGEAAAIRDGWTFVRVEGHVPRDTPYAPLSMYLHTGFGDQLTTKLNSELSVDALRDGWFRTTGFDGAIWRFPFPQTTLFKNYWNFARADHFALATTASENEAIAAGYFQVGNEDIVGLGSNAAYRGYVYTSSVSGMSPMNSYYQPHHQDHLTSILFAGPPLGYQFVRTEGWGLAVNP
jgi:hypothetical protein